MPAGPTAFGLAYFAGAKLLGYSAYSKLILDNLEAAPKPDSKKPPAILVGVARTLLGMAVGAAFGLSFFWIADHLQRDHYSRDYSVFVFYGLLIPIRFLEWKLIFIWLRRKYSWFLRHETGAIIGGILVSFLLDAIGVAALWVLPGGAWVC